MTRGLLSILIKHAAELQPKPKHQEMLDTHFGTHEQERWRDFRRAVRSKTFVNALKTDDRADDKMKRYAEAMYLHYADKSCESFTVPGHKKSYTVKFHPKQERYSCSCPDWGYTKSHQTSKDAQDCKHIKQVKLELQSQDQMKTAGFNPKHLAGTLNILSKKNKLDDQTLKDRMTVRAYKQQMPQMTGQGVGPFDFVTSLVSPFVKRAAMGRAARRILDQKE